MAASFDVSAYAARLATMTRLILAPDRAFFWQAVVFSVAISLLTLAVPLSVQILIGSVANIALLRPIVVLSVVLFALLALYGLLVAAQAHLMDVFERRLFARVTEELVLRSIHARYAEVESLNREELANRFFEIVTIQRNLPTLVINGSAMVLQAVVGFAVVSAYHPAFLVFNAGVLLLMYGVWKVWAGPAIRSKLASSYAKFQVAHWLEELARANAFFKARRAIDYAVARSEHLIADYVRAHRRHFRFKFAQQVGFLALYAAASAALLGLGGWLVISNALTLGQLVAAELILSAVFLSMARVSGLLEEFYELCAALYKLGDYFEFPLEQPVARTPLPAAPAGLGLRGAVTAHRSREFRFDFALAPGTKALVVVDSFSLQKGLLDLLLRHTEPARGTVLLGDANLADLDVHALRDAIVVVDNTGVLQCSLEENLALGDPAITRAAMRDMLEVVGLTPVLAALPEGLETPLGAYGYPLSRSETLRLKIAAALLGRPRVLVLTQVFDTLAHHHRRMILDHLLREPDVTLINFSNRRDVSGFDSYLYLEPDRHHEFRTMSGLQAFERSRENAGAAAGGGVVP